MEAVNPLRSVIAYPIVASSRQPNSHADDAPAHAARTAYTLPVDLGAGGLPDLQRFGILAVIDADFRQDGVDVALDEREALFVHYLVNADPACVPAPADRAARLTSRLPARCVRGVRGMYTIRAARQNSTLARRAYAVTFRTWHEVIWFLTNQRGC